MIAAGLISQAEIDDKPDQWKRVGVEQGFLRYMGQGSYIQRQHKRIEA